MIYYKHLTGILWNKARYSIMLIQFSVQNHRSIRDNAVISFAASKDNSLESYLLHPDEKRTLLPVVALYGANAAGKSNVLHAIMTVRNMITGEASKLSKGQKLPWEPFGGAISRLHLRSCIFTEKYGMCMASLSMRRRYIPSICIIGRMVVKRSSSQEKTVHTNSVRMLRSRQRLPEEHRTTSCILFLPMTGIFRRPKTHIVGSWKI